MKLAIPIIVIIFLCGLWWALQPASAYPSYLAGIQTQLTATAQTQDLVRETALKDALLPFQTVALAALYLSVPVMLFSGLGYALWRATRPLTPDLRPPTYTRMESLPVVAKVPAQTPVTVTGLPGVTNYGTLGHNAATGILLGVGANGARYVVPPGDALCHVLVFGSTGGGKSTFYRLVLAQLIAAGCDVWLLDPHYAPVDPKNGDEWWPIAQASAPRRAIFETHEIIAVINAAIVELDRRLKLRHLGQPWGPPRFYAIEEAPILADYDPNFLQKFGKLLKEGRKVDLFGVLSSQSALQRVLGGTSADTAQFGTLAYMGADVAAATRLFGAKVEEPPGKGLARLKCSMGIAGRYEGMVRVPMLPNHELRTLLGTATVETAQRSTWGDDLIDLVAQAPPVVPVAAIAEPQCTAKGITVSRGALVARMRQGGGQMAIIKDLWQGKVVAGGGQDYIAVNKFYNETVEWLAHKG